MLHDICLCHMSLADAPVFEIHSRLTESTANPRWVPGSQDHICATLCDHNTGCRGVAAIPDVSELKVTSRVLHLPMAFEESCSKDAMQKYSQSVRPEAAYLPDNVPFVAEINGLEGGADEVRRIMFEASYMVCASLASAGPHSATPAHADVVVMCWLLDAPTCHIYGCSAICNCDGLYGSKAALPVMLKDYPSCMKACGK